MVGSSRATPAPTRPISRTTSCNAWGVSPAGPSYVVPDTPESRAEMPFLDHLEELRWRILYSLLAVVVGTLVGWVIVEHIDVIGLLIEPIKPLIPGGKLRVTSPTEPFFITLKFALVVGVVLAPPVVGYQTWAFLTPRLAPPDADSMLLMMVPLWLLYEVSIWCAWVVEKRRRRRQRAEGGAASAVALGVLLLLALGGSLEAQIPTHPPLRPPRPDTARTA